MAFVSIDDGYGELEVIVFARQYARFENDIFDENAVYIVGTISEEEGECPRILLSTLYPLYPNDRFSQDLLQNQKHKAKQKNPTEKKSELAKNEPLSSSRLFVKIESLKDRRIRSLERLALLNGGETQIVLFDSSTKKYVSMKDTYIRADESVLQRLYELFGQENIILRS
jgi:DNA polymerase-3 subunit alpha